MRAVRVKFQEAKKRALALCFARKCYEWSEHHNRFCLKHWQLLPEDLQRLLWTQYSIRQSVEAQSDAWKRGVIAAIELIAAKEGVDRWLT